jgi:hypothetical protein
LRRNSHGILNSLQMKGRGDIQGIVCIDTKLKTLLLQNPRQARLQQ